jgi:glycerol uptake facilitator-like aquaporin
MKTPIKRSNLRRYAAEMIGTFGIIFFWTGMTVIPTSMGILGHSLLEYLFLGLAIFGLTLAVGRVSGAHFNPAVTFAFWVARKIKTRRMLIYFACQTIAVFLAVGLFRVFFPLLGEPESIQPGISLLKTLVFESVVIFLLTFVIMRVSQRGKITGQRGALAAGSMYAVITYLTAPFHYPAGHSLRAAALALFSSRLDEIWVYFAAAIIGSAVAAFASTMIDKIDPLKKKEGTVIKRPPR